MWVFIEWYQVSDVNQINGKHVQGSDRSAHPSRGTLQSEGAQAPCSHLLYLWKSRHPGFLKYPYHQDTQKQFVSKLFCSSCFAQEPMLAFLCLLCTFFFLNGNHSASTCATFPLQPVVTQWSFLINKTHSSQLNHGCPNSTPLRLLQAGKKEGEAGVQAGKLGYFCRRQL